MEFRGWGEFHFTVHADDLDDAQRKFNAWMERIDNEEFLLEHGIEIDDVDAGVHNPEIFKKDNTTA